MNKRRLKAQLRPQSGPSEVGCILALKVLTVSNQKRLNNIIYLSHWIFPKAVWGCLKADFFCSKCHLKCYIVHSTMIPVNKN